MTDDGARAIAEALKENHALASLDISRMMCSNDFTDGMT